MGQKSPQLLLLRIGIIIFLIIATFQLAPPATAQEPIDPAPPIAQQPSGPPPAIGPDQPPPPEPEEKPLRIPLTEVIGTGPDAMEHIPGSGRVITKETIEKNHRLTVNEALREVPGVHVRDEDGLGIRPNIGIRGLDPTRSRKVHIMEDGVPIMLMPYGDPSAYYFPPIFRFDRIEVLKGSGQLLYGPQNIGGVINLITRMPPQTPQGNIQLWGGNLGYFNTHFDYGGTWGKSGYLIDVTHFQMNSPRFGNNRVRVDDITFKTVQELSDRTQILAKINYYRENSEIGYQGLTEHEWGGLLGRDRVTPFDNERMDFRRTAVHVAVNHMFTANLTSTTNFFGHYISRDWTRQAIAQQNDSGDGCVLPPFTISNGICSNAERTIPINGQATNAREYWVYGVEPRFHYNHALFGIDAEADFGARYMYEESQRIQYQNQISLGPPTSCLVPGNLTCLGENNTRHTNAYAAFFQEKFIIGRFTITPGVRLEHINYEATNALPQSNIGAGTTGTASFTEVLPGVGITYQPFKDHTLFAGAHRGMSPPLVSDAVTGTGAVVDLGPELSWTYEVGARGNVTQWAGYEVTLFQMDFSNQIISQSAAGGIGSTLTSAGKTRHRGIELATKLDLLDAFTGLNRDQDIVLDLNYTWVAQSEFIGTKNTNIGCISLLPSERAAMGCDPVNPAAGSPANPISVSGNRLPYSPQHLFTAGIAYNNRAFSPGAFSARLEAQCISDQFSDDINLQNATPSGQRGIVRGWCMLNASINQYVKKLNMNFFLVGKNMLGQDVIVDRTRGIYPGLPALFQAGAKWTF